LTSSKWQTATLKDSGRVLQDFEKVVNKQTLFTISDWLSKLMGLFNLMRVTRLDLRWTPTCPTLTPGNISLGVVADAADVAYGFNPDFTDPVRVASAISELDRTASFPVWQERVIPLVTNGKMSPVVRLDETVLTANIYAYGLEASTVEPSATFRQNTPWGVPVAIATGLSSSNLYWGSLGYWSVDTVLDLSGPRVTQDGSRPTKAIDAISGPQKWETEGSSPQADFIIPSADLSRGSSKIGFSAERKRAVSRVLGKHSPFSRVEPHGAGSQVSVLLDETRLASSDFGVRITGLPLSSTVRVKGALASVPRSGADWSGEAGYWEADIIPFTDEPVILILGTETEGVDWLVDMEWWLLD
jgi:hypothetical protein